MEGDQISQKDTGFTVEEEEEKAKQVADLKDRLTREILDRERSQREVCSLKSFLRSSISDQHSLLIHELRCSGTIKSPLVYQSLLVTESTDFYDDDADEGDSESRVRDHAILLETISSFADRGSRILVLISGFPASLLLSLCWIVADLVSLPPSSHDSSLPSSFSSSSSSSSSAMAAAAPTVIARTTLADARLIKKKYAFLVESHLLRINVFSESSVLRNGYPRGAPFDVILVPEIGWSEGLKAQLRPNGAFINPFDLSVKLVKRPDGCLMSV